MSIQATNWALRDAPVGGDTTSRLILVILGDYAKSDGSEAYPSVRSIAHTARVSERSVRRHLRSLAEAGVIRRGNQEVVHHIREDRRPVVWDLVMGHTDEAACTSDRDSSCDMASVSGRAAIRGDADGRRGVTSASPKPLDNPSIPSYNPPKNSKLKPQSEPKQTRTQLADDWSPTTEAKQYASERDIDLRRAVDRFRLWAKADGRRLRDWDARFMLWLTGERPMRSTHSPYDTSVVEPKVHTHSYRCSHVLGLLQRGGDDAQPDELAVALAVQLNQGISGKTALAKLGFDAQYGGE